MKEGCDNVSINYGEKDGYWMGGTCCTLIHQNDSMACYIVGLSK